MSGDDSNGKLVRVAEAGLAVLALFVALGSCYKSDEANRISRMALKANQDQISRENTPTIEVAYYIAKSPDLQAEYDSRWIDRLQLAWRRVPTRFWRTEWSQYKGDPEKWYLFICIVNRGPGRAERINITSYTWVPKINERRPDGLMDMEAPLGILDRGQFYALLVDTLRTPDLAKPLESTHFVEMTLKVEYTDALGREYKPLEIGIGKGIPLGPLYHWIP